MTRPQTTPSPWNYDSYTCEIFAGKEATRYCLGFTAQPHLDLHKANAKAISALPDCLVALEAILKDYGLANLGELDSEVSTHKPLIMAKAALTKAGYTF